MIDPHTNDLEDFYERQYERDLSESPLIADDDFLYGQVIAQVRPYVGPGVRALDLGCHTGALSLWMASKGCDVVGIDLAESAVQSAGRSAQRHSLSNVSFRRMNFVEEWNEAGVFDLVLCSHVIEHVPDDEALMVALARSMKPGGRIVLLTPTVYSLLYRWHRWRKQPFLFDTEVGHLRRYDAPMLVGRMLRAGFTECSVVYLDSPIRELLFIPKTFRKLQAVLRLPVLRDIMNRVDSRLAALAFPATVCVHAKRA